MNLDDIDDDLDLEVPNLPKVRAEFSSTTDPNSNVGRDEMYEIITRLVQDALYTDIPLPEYLLSKVSETDAKGRPIGVTPAFELRHVGLKFSERGIIGHVTAYNFSWNVALQMQEAAKRLTSEQPSCDWRIVAARIVQENQARTFREGGQMPEFGDAAAVAAALATGQAAANGATILSAPNLATAKSVIRKVPDNVARVHLVFADVAHAELVDPWEERTQQVGKAPIAQYITSGRQLRYMPRSLRVSRERAEEIIRWMIKSEEHLRTEPQVQAEYADPLADERIVATLAAARRSGVTFADLARPWGVPWRRVREVVNDYLRKTGVKVDEGDDDEAS